MCKKKKKKLQNYKIMKFIFHSLKHRNRKELWNHILKINQKGKF